MALVPFMFTAVALATEPTEATEATKEEEILIDH